MSEREAFIWYGFDPAKDKDQTAYWLYCDGQYKQISEEEYWKLYHERRIEPAQGGKNSIN